MLPLKSTMATQASTGMPSVIPINKANEAFELMAGPPRKPHRKGCPEGRSLARSEEIERAPPVSYRLNRRRLLPTNWGVPVQEKRRLLRVNLGTVSRAEPP